jgi:hypothetical protein
LLPCGTSYYDRHRQYCQCHRNYINCCLNVKRR